MAFLVLLIAFPTLVGAIAGSALWGALIGVAFALGILLFAAWPGTPPRRRY